MSRYFKMEVQVSKYNPKQLPTILEALMGMMETEPLDNPIEPGKSPKVFSLTGEVNLCGGKTADEFANELAQAVWTANGRYCHVDVESTYLEFTPPSDRHTWTKGDYSEWRDGI